MSARKVCDRPGCIAYRTAPHGPSNSEHQSGPFERGHGYHFRLAAHGRDPWRVVMFVEKPTMDMSDAGIAALLRALERARVRLADAR